MLVNCLLVWCGLMLLRGLGQLALVFIAHEVHRINGYLNAPDVAPASRPRPQLRVLPGDRT